MAKEQYVQFQGASLIEEEFTALNEISLFFNVNMKLETTIGDENAVWIKNSHVSVLSITNINLFDFPTQLLKFSHLKKLYLHSDNIETIPNWITQFTELEYLSLKKNQIKTLNYACLPNKLKAIDLSHNLIQDIPKINNKNLNLIQVGLEYNQIKNIPEMFQDLENIRTIILDGNQIQALPKWMKQFSQLRALFLNNCRLKIIPENLLLLTNLTDLFLNNNLITSLPKELLHLPVLKRIEIKNNQFNADFLTFSKEELDKLVFDASTFKDQKYPTTELCEFVFKRFLLSENKLIKLLPDGEIEIDRFSINLYDHSVEVECENITIRPNESPYPKEVMGIHTIDGHPFLGVSGGGDWEFPVFFILFEEKDRKKGHIPPWGNAWNQETNQAFGNDLMADKEFLLKQEAGVEKGLPPLEQKEVRLLRDLVPYIEAMISAENLLEDIGLFFKFH